MFVCFVQFADRGVQSEEYCGRGRRRACSGGDRLQRRRRSVNNDGGRRRSEEERLATRLRMMTASVWRLKAE